MIPARRLLRRTALVAALGGVSTDAGPLRVLRTTPTDSAPPASAITVTFDRPVAGSLDRTVDPRAILSVAPVVAGAHLVRAEDASGAWAEVRITVD
jgi:hypothetical protein